MASRVTKSKPASKTLAPKAFIKELEAKIKARRTFGSHPLWLEIADGKLDPGR